MRLADFKDHFNSDLAELFPATEIQSFLSIVLEEYLGLQRIDLVTRPNMEIDSEKLETLISVLNRLKNQEPIQYIIGETEFFGLPFKVNKNVLIPRPETEELVEWIISESSEMKSSKDSTSLSLLDIGTGSGCIPISIKKNKPFLEVFGIDISTSALEIATQNAQLNDVDIRFIQTDILVAEKLNRKFDIIVSNPPYVRELEKKEISDNVLDYEPGLALFVSDEDPLIFYRKIASLAKTHLAQNGLLFFEINEYLGKEMTEMLRLLGFQNVLLKKDLFGKDRMIKASL